MRLTLVTSLCALAALVSGCATSGSAPSGVVPGKFATFSCEGGKTFQARWAEDGKSVRVRAHHGSAELAPMGGGVYEGEGYRLTTQGEGAVQLMHGGKPQARACKAA
jgi:hypothetical protein